MGAIEGRRNVSYRVIDADVFDLAAAYTAAIIANHPFVDGNKRTGFVVVRAQKQKNSDQHSDH